MTMFLQYTISFMLLSMVIGASYYGVDDYELDNDGDDARNEEREAGGCKYPGRACSAGGWYSYGCYFSHDRIGGIKMRYCWRQCWSNEKEWCTVEAPAVSAMIGRKAKECYKDSDCVPDEKASAASVCMSKGSLWWKKPDCKTGDPPLNQ